MMCSPAEQQELETGMPIRLKTYLVLMLVLLVLIPLTSRAADRADLNRDGTVDLIDALLGLTILADTAPAIPEVAADIDVDNDGKIGMAEVLFVLNTALAAPQPLNDTGITWGGNYPEGNNTTCTSNIDAPQDCHQGRDATHNDPSDGHGGFSYTKLDASGNSLPASAATWSCVRDNVTGLVWEVKTDDGGIHDRDNTYRWGGKTALGTGYGEYYPDWDTLVDGSNTERLCGYSDWRVPTRTELQGLVHYGRSYPAIDTDYLPNRPASYFWSASPSGGSSSSAWVVAFGYGSAGYDNDRSYDGHVRLVRSGQ